MTRAHRPGEAPIRRASQVSGLEIASRRPYAPGDDMRHIDWRTYGRLDRLYVKTFRAHGEAPINIFLDVSRSMLFPKPDGKRSFAAAICAGLCYISLQQRNPVRIVLVGDSKPPYRLSPEVLHPQRFPVIEKFLRQLPVDARGDPWQGIAKTMQRQRPRGRMIVVSDFLASAQQWESALAKLVSRHTRLDLIRPLGIAERGMAHLPHSAHIHDAESNLSRRIRWTDENRRRYDSAMRGHLAKLTTWSKRHRATLTIPDPAKGLATCFLEELCYSGVLSR